MNYNEVNYNEQRIYQTYSICKALKESSGDVRKEVINYFNNKFFNRSLDTCKKKESERKPNDLHILYTAENIEKERKVQLSFTVVRESREYFINDKELYQYALEVVENFSLNNSTRDDNASFSLFFFLGTLCSHLSKYEAAYQNYVKAKDFAKESTSISALEKRLAKLQAINISSYNNNDDCISSEDALLSKTYLDCEVLKVYCFRTEKEDSNLSAKEIFKTYSDVFEFCGLNNFLTRFKNIGCTKLSKLVLKLNALDSLNHNRFKILFAYKVPNRAGTGDARGFYNGRNTVRVLVKFDHSGYESTLFHELIHKTMDRVFNNRCVPYFENDEEAKQAYREAMKGVLLNLIVCGSINDDIKVENLALNEIIPFCFSEQFLANAIKSNKEPGILSLFKGLERVFLNYPIAMLDSEFITHALQYLIHAQNSPSYINCVKPLLDYVEKYVIPKMEEYIHKHPCRDRIKES